MKIVSKKIITGLILCAGLFMLTGCGEKGPMDHAQSYIETVKSGAYGEAFAQTNNSSLSNIVSNIPGYLYENLENFTRAWKILDVDNHTQVQYEVLESDKIRREARLQVIVGERKIFLNMKDDRVNFVKFPAYIAQQIVAESEAELSAQRKLVVKPKALETAPVKKTVELESDL